MKKRDYYEVLSVTRTADEQEIKISYRKAAMTYHPDRNPGDKSAEEKFKEASEAYEVLSNSEKRARYDRFGHEGVNSQGFQDVNDIFSSFGNIFEEFFGFSTGGAGGGRPRSRRGADLRYDLQLEFQESIFGIEKEIEFERAATCETCSGSGAKPGTGKSTCKTCGGVGQVRRTQGFFSIASPCPTCEGEGVRLDSPCQPCRGAGRTMKKKKLMVKIPRGVDTGVRLRVSGEGEPGPNSGTPGDLYVVLHVKESEEYVREDLDLIKFQNIGIAQASLGCTLKVKTLEAEIDVVVPPGVQHGHRVSVPGSGVPQLKGGGRGDLYIELHVAVPKKLTKEQRELLQKYAEISGEESTDSNGGFFHRIFGE